MTTIYQVPGQGRRPIPHAIPEPVVIPLDIDRVKVVDHARRVAHLTRAWSLSGVGLPMSAREAYGDLMAIGVALSWATDLGMVGDRASGSLSTDDIRAAVFPAAPKTPRFRAAIGADAPRYEPHWSRDHACPVGGPRGGKCPGTPRPTKWVTNLETGEWGWANVCDRHLDVARQRSHSSPDPGPNLGGVLAEVFPEIDMDVLYSWARPGWVPVGEPAPVEDAVVARRAFRIIAGGTA